MLFSRQVLRAGIGLDEVNRRVRDSLSTLADVALEIAMEREVCHRCFLPPAAGNFINLFFVFLLLLLLLLLLLVEP